MVAVVGQGHKAAVGIKHPGHRRKERRGQGRRWHCRGKRAAGVTLSKREAPETAATQPRQIHGAHSTAHTDTTQ